MFDNVLVIDDDPIFCEVMQTYLKQSGAKTITVAHDGRGALANLQQNLDQTDFIILDLNMPDLDGIELLNKLKELSFSGSIAVVSGETPVVINMAASLARQYGLNVIDARKKPVDKSVVDRWISGSGD
ncbi:MAG: response regulator [Aestuariivirgaceae bacterium]